MINYPTLTFVVILMKRDIEGQDIALERPEIKQKCSIGACTQSLRRRRWKGGRTLGMRIESVEFIPKSSVCF